ncbi:Rrf2 family transcriptional regulator [Lentisphaera profundi]|uniref:Rrf2 family transcriptional regulator n=1 Tax=Lentisphaera profundi TaxID=1658616 RepID=A0ABY7VSS6_9BACT|nr:Rrf2 family transcriptional regulator [Lentisphaera profundi]WDE96772.1 Rrf2 family transcriptional regulator [Lentisphaera profundi]
MFKLNKKVEYAIIALQHMKSVDDGAMSTVKEICELYGAPFDVTSRAMQKMASAGILKSIKGAHGGYLIQQDLGELKLLDLIESISGDVSLASCVIDPCNCDMIASCNIVDPITRLNELLRKFFAEMTVLDLLQGKKSQPQMKEVCHE